MTRCNAVITNLRGDVVRCASTKSSHSKHGCCYYHEKVFAGLCSPVEYRDDVVVEAGEQVVEVRTVNGDEVRTF